MLLNIVRRCVKMYNYIPLPSNMRDFSSVVTMRIEEGSSGFGVYVMLLSLLRDMPDYRVGDNAKRLAFVINEGDVSLVDRVCHQYGLFDIDDDGLLYSPWLCQAMEAYDEKKKKLREAGRKGAAKRFGSSSMDDGQAIATPSMDDGQAIANTTYHNLTYRNMTQPDTKGSVQDWRDIVELPSPLVSMELVEALSSTSPEGHAPGYIAQVCHRYKMKESTLNYLCELTNNADIGNSTYQSFVSLVSRIEREKWTPSHPDNFFLSKTATNDH